MSVRIRLSRGGAKKRPFHKIVVADKRDPRDGRFIEEIGFYNPLVPKDAKDALRVDVAAAKKWMAQGAEITERVQKLFATIGLTDKPAQRETPKKSAPKAKAQERLKAAAERAAAVEAEKAAAAEAARIAAETPAEPVAETPAEPAVEPAAEPAPAETPAEQPAEKPAE